MPRSLGHLFFGGTDQEEVGILGFVHFLLKVEILSLLLDFEIKSPVTFFLIVFNLMLLFLKLVSSLLSKVKI